MKPHNRRRHGLLAAALGAVAALFLAVPCARADVTPPSDSTLADLVYPTGPQYIAMAPWMTQTGWDISEVIFKYNANTDTLDVDVKTTGIAGDADGLGKPGGNDPQLRAIGGVNPANLGGRDSFSIAFVSANANHSLGNPVAIAGVPEYKPANSPNDGFQLATYTGGTSLASAYGGPVAMATGTLLYSPSAAHPDFEFTISNFSKLYGLELANGFYFSAYAGSPDDAVVGEDHIPWTYINGYQSAPQITNFTPSGWLLPPEAPTPTPAPQFNPVPEPASLTLFAAGGLGLWLASRKRRTPAATLA
jgi:hypothetical protein